MKRKKEPKPLTQKQYLSRFTWLARWRLPPDEASEVIADYREMVGQEDRDEAKLVEELGTPDQAVWLLTDGVTYRRWLWVFGILAFGLLMCARWSWTGWDRLRLFGIDYFWHPVWVLAVGLVLSVVWFRRQGYKNGPLSRGLLLCLAAVLIFALAVLWLTWRLHDPKFLERFAELSYEQLKGTSLYRWIIMYRELLIDGGTLCPVIALAGLVLARCKDRRWLALYTLALTAAAMCVILEFWMLGMDLSYASVEDARTYLFPWLIPMGVAGLIGTGVALC